MEWLWRIEERDRGERLAAAVEETLSLLPLHLERVVRDHFELSPNPKLEDISPGELDDALRIISRPEVSESLREFV